MAYERPDIWDDVNVKQALADGRQPDDIAVLNCPICGNLSYYNQGSSFCCKDENCQGNHGFRVLVQEEAEAADYKDRHTIILDHLLTLEDVLEAECADYPP